MVKWLAQLPQSRETHTFLTLLNGVSVICLRLSVPLTVKSHANYSKSIGHS